MYRDPHGLARFSKKVGGVDNAGSRSGAPKEEKERAMSKKRIDDSKLEDITGGNSVIDLGDGGSGDGSGSPQGPGAPPKRGGGGPSSGEESNPGGGGSTDME
jgi:hypothetical protein